MRRPIFVAIGGDSGSGKSTLTAGFYRIFPRDQITSVCLDDYHGLDRRERNLIGITALDPRANNFALMENQLLALKRGNPIMKPVYDHSDGTFGPPEEIQPRQVVIVQGLHPFLVPGLRGLFDLNVWLDPETELKHKWKVQRDVARRGYTREQVLRGDRGAGTGRGRLHHPAAPFRGPHRPFLPAGAGAGPATTST